MNFTNTPSSYGLSSPAVFSHRSQPHPSEAEELFLVTDEQHVVEIIKQKERQRWNYGLFVMFVSIVSWMIGNQIINSVIKNGSYSGQPIFISYMTGSGFLIYTVPELWRFLKYKMFFTPYRNLSTTISVNSSSSEGAGGTGISAMTLLSPSRYEDINGEEEQHQFSNRDMVSLSVQIAFIYFMTNLLGLLLLEFTSSSQQVLLTTASSFFTLILGGVFQIEAVTLKKLGILLLLVMGVSLITLNDANSGDQELLKNPILGDFLLLCGSFCYACYIIIVKVKIGETSVHVNERLLFGLVGVSTMVLYWPLILLAQYLPFMEPFVQPPDLTVWIIVVMNGVLVAISDYCSVILMLLTSPLVASLSLTAAIPIGMMCDSVFYGINNSGVAYYAGIVFIGASLVAINVADETVDGAIDEALEDAIMKDENLSPLLSPLLSPQLHRGIGTGLELFNFDRDHIRSIGEHGNSNRVHEIYVSGGYNHKYVIRGLDRY